MRAEEFDDVRLKDGRVVTVLEVFDGGKAYLVEESDHDGRAVDIFDIPENDIEKIVWEHKTKKFFGEG